MTQYMDIAHGEIRLMVEDNGSVTWSPSEYSRSIVHDAAKYRLEALLPRVSMLEHALKKLAHPTGETP